MKKLLLIAVCFSFFTFHFLFSFGQGWVWGSGSSAPNYHGFGDIFGNHTTAVDKYGNAYLVGIFRDTLNFSGFKISANSRANVFLSKYNALGKVIWAEEGKATTNSEEWGSSVAVDMHGNSYITGYIRDSIIFGGYTLVNKTGFHDNFYIAKYDSTGKILWAKQSISASNASQGAGASVTMDASGNAYVTGYFVDTLSFGTDTLISSITRSENFFLVKYDYLGNVIWAKHAQLIGNYSEVFVQSVATDNLGDVYMDGGFADTVVFGKDTLRSLTSNFIVKYDTSGKELWAKQDSIIGYGGWGWGNDIAVDLYGNSYVLGDFQDTIKFGKFTIRTTNRGSVFLVKYSPSGNLLWAEQCNILDANQWYAYAVTCNKSGGYFVMNNNSGASPYKVEFGGDTFALNSTYSSSTILINFDSSGKVICGTIFSEGDEDDQDGVAMDSTGQYVYLGGDLDELQSYQTIVFGIDTFTYSEGGPFMARWQPCISSSLLILSSSGNKTCQNSCTGTASATPTGGSPPYTYLWSDGETAQVDTGLCGGIYTVTVTDASGNKVTVTDTVAMNLAPMVSSSFQSEDSLRNATGSVILFGNPLGGIFYGSGVYGSNFYPDSAKLGVYNLFSYTYTDTSGCSATVEDSLYVDDCTGGSELIAKSEELKVEPNPNSGIFTLTLPSLPPCPPRGAKTGRRIIYRGL